MKTCPPCTGNCNQGRSCPARTSAKMANAIVNWLLAPLFIIALAAIGYYIDAQPDMREETANILALQDAQAAAAAERRRELEAYNACKSDHGPNVAVAWNLDGMLICQPKRGTPTTRSAPAQARESGSRPPGSLHLQTSGTERAAGF